MANNFLARRLLRRPATNTELVQVRRELDAFAAACTELRDSALWLRRALEAIEIPASVLSWPLDPDVAREKLAAGIPLLRGEAVKLDAEVFERRWGVACRALGRRDPRRAALMRAVRSGQFAPQQIADAIVAGRPQSVLEQAAALRLDASLFATLTRLSLFPEFSGLQRHTAPLLTQTAWQRGYCWLCGSWPLLGEYRGLDQLRYLRCGLCAAAWKVPRLFCAYCETRAHEQLSTFHLQGEETQRGILHCKSCRRYTKMLVTLGALAPLQLWVTDLMTLPLDLAAAERGWSV